MCLVALARSQVCRAHRPGDRQLVLLTVITAIVLFIEQLPCGVFDNTPEL
jgi:hypothetical protein